MAYGGKPKLNELEETLQEEWIVMMKEGTTDAQIEAMCKVAQNGCRMSGHPDAGGVAFLDMHGTEKDLEAVIESSNGAVQLVEVDQILSLIPELDVEPASSSSWGLDRVGSRGRTGNQGAGTHIFILDTGVRSTHNDFGDRATPQVDFSPITGRKECNGDLTCAADNQGHGTHCAGTAAGGTFGVVSQAKVYGIKVLGDSGAGNLFAIIGSVDYLATTPQRPAVGSMSLGGTCPFGFCGLYFAMKMAVDKAVASGVTVVVAGGNSNTDACGFMPAYIPSAITVGSTDSVDARSSFSNYGKCTDIWAPGSKITSATHEDDTGAKTFSGTSMACPHVAGGAALILEQFPEFKSPQVLEKLLARAATNYITDLQTGDVNKLLYIAADAPPKPGNVVAVSGTGDGNSCSAEIGHCGLAYQACCIGFGVDGQVCGCNLQDGSGKSGAGCGFCGIAYRACCVGYSIGGHPCECDVM